jgi:hypothetical protein
MSQDSNYYSNKNKLDGKAKVGCELMINEVI